MSTYLLLGAVAVGAVATLVMDLWNLFLKRVFGIPSLDMCLLGRWLRHLPTGAFRHESIAAAAKKPRECAVGYAAHYAIGAGLAGMLVAITSGEWLLRPALLPALLFGIVTVVFPFFLLQPALGLGVASSRTRRPAQARVKSLMSHVAFGFGLHLGATALRLLVPAPPA